MKCDRNILRRLMIIGSLALYAQVVRAQPQVVFDNSTTDLNIRYDPGTNEVGDEIVLAPGTGRNLTQFRFQYWGTNFSGTEKIDLRFYANDGLPSYSGPNMPGTLLFDSGPFTIFETDRLTIIFNNFATGVAHALAGAIPNDFTWSVQFSGLGPGASAGVDLYNPPTVGSDYNDYWYNNGTSWDLMGATNGTPVNFAVRIQATPEPPAIWLSLIGGLTIFGLKWRRGRK
jgi:hypothetical protein